MLKSCEHDRKEQRMTIANTTCVTSRGRGYVAQVDINGVTKYLGTYYTIREAVKAIAEFDIEYYGYRVRNLDWEV